MRVIKRILKVDSQGRPIRSYVKEIATDPQGNVTTDVEHRFERCPNCGKSILGEEDVEVSCAVCAVQLCKSCAIRCAGCGVGLCYRHARSFPGHGLAFCLRCMPMKERYEEALLELELVKERDIDLPGTLGLLAKMVKNAKLAQLERKIRRLGRG